MIAPRAVPLLALGLRQLKVQRGLGAVALAQLHLQNCDLLLQDADPLVHLRLLRLLLGALALLQEVAQHAHLLVMDGLRKHRNILRQRENMTNNSLENDKTPATNMTNIWKHDKRV